MIHSTQFDNFPHLDEARSVDDRQLIAVTSVRSTLNAGAGTHTPACLVVDAYMLPDGVLALINGEGEMVGGICPQLIIKFGEQA